MERETIRKRLKIERRIESEVIDRRVLLTLGYLMNKGIIETVDYPISKGKEAYVFRATAGKNMDEKYLAVKIYMIETSRFKNMDDYIVGDPRFRRIKHTKNELVYAWTKKEFRNLRLCREAGVNVPKPFFFKNNVLVMSLIGNEGEPAPQLKDVGPGDPEKDFRHIITEMKKMYRFGLVHADLSEFNILIREGQEEGEEDEIAIIDLGQGVLLGHPMAEKFLERDLTNIIRYYKKFGVKADFDKLLEEIKGKKKKVEEKNEEESD